jgi:hypothetical protein
LDKLFAHVNKNIAEVLPNVAEEIKKIVQHEIWELLYSSYNHEYQRTYDFIDSVSVKNINKLSDGTLEIEIYYDSSKIIPSVVENSKYNQHMDYYGNDVPDKIPLWLESGTDANNGNFFPRDGIGAMKKVAEEEKLRFESKLLNELKKKGWDVIFVG